MEAECGVNEFQRYFAAEFEKRRDYPQDYCLGANLSRLEGRVALEEIAKRVASFFLRDTNDYSYHPSFMLRGLVKLDVDVVPA